MGAIDIGDQLVISEFITVTNLVRLTIKVQLQEDLDIQGINMHILRIVHGERRRLTTAGNPNSDATTIHMIPLPQQRQS